MRSLPRQTILVLTLAVLALLAGGAWYYAAQEKQILEQTERELASIAHLKAGQIGKWRDDLLDEAAEITDRPILLERLRNFLAAPDAASRAEILAELTALHQHDDFADVLLTDGDGQIALSVRGEISSLPEHSRAAVVESLHTRAPVLIDLHLDEQSGEPHIAVVAPVQPAGAVILIADATDYLYPLVQSWPVPSESGESLLVRREGDELVFLNELRHRQDTALKLRFPISQTALPAAQAIQGVVGIASGKDYRGVDVIAALEPVPGAPWYLVAKVDRVEALAGWRSRATLIALFVGALVLILGAIALIGTQRAEKERYRLLYQAEAERRASDQRFRAMIAAMPDLFFRLDRDGRFLECQTSDPGRLLLPPAAFIGKTVAEVLPPHIAGPAATAIAQALATGETQSFEYELETAGRREWFDQRIVKVSADEVLAITRDISAGRRSALLAATRLHLLAFAATHSLDELLQETLDRVGELVNSPVGFYHFVEPDQKTLALQAWSTLTLRDFCQAEGKGLHYDIEQAGVWADCVRLRRPVMHNDFAAVPNQRGMPDGHADVVRELVVPIFRQDRVVAILGVGNKPTNYGEEDLELVTYLADVAWEITERKRVEEALHKEQQQIAALADNLPGIAARVDGDLRYQYASRGHVEAYGLQPDAIVGRTMRDVLGAEAFGRVEPYARRALAGEQVSWENPVRPGGDQVGWRWTTFIPDRQAGAAIDGFFILEIDITAQHQAEEDYRTLFQSMLDGFALHEIILDAQGTPVDYRFLAVNPAFERMTGLSAAQVIGKTIREVLPNTEQEWIDRYGQVVLTGEPIEFKSYAQELGRHYEVSAFRPVPGQFVSFFADITDRKHAEAEQVRLQEQLIQAQKMEMVGRLAGGVAHDFNNMLAAILMRAELALMQTDAASPMHRHLTEILKTAERSAALTRQLLGYARKQTIVPKVLNLNTLVNSMSTMLQRLIGEQIELAWRPQADLWPVKMDPSQVDQILVNLVVNARDAIDGAGRIIVEMANLSVDERYHSQWPEMAPGDYVMLAVSDNGRGMDAQTLSHIFEPFYTTKQHGKGTGLGLATVYGIVQQNQGVIHVYSEPQVGTTFKIYLPHSAEVGDDEALPPVDTLPSGEGITVLLAEDEDVVRAMGVEILEGFGYTVLEAGGPAAALEYAGAYAGAIDLLVTDVIMPGLNGRELVERVIALRPEIKVLYISGYPADFISDRAVLEDGVNFLQKPFSLRSLALKVHEALNGNAHAPTAPG
ncbi:MAG: PAS domain-containing protein [Caldilineaceae bacterium]|nr:PAS domain-containing protein [Caldilineaceae bacterium]